jgi:hypothetical protein
LNNPVPLDEDHLVLFAYLFSCLASLDTELSTFQKLPVGDKTHKSWMKLLWAGRMNEKKEELMRAAKNWAGLENDGNVFQPFVDGDSPPSVLSLPHLAAQSLVNHVSPFSETLIVVSQLDNDSN